VTHELGLLDDLLKIPHQKASQINGVFAGLAVTPRATDFWLSTAD
jgi:hypothetical protein